MSPVPPASEQTLAFPKHEGVHRELKQQQHEAMEHVDKKHPSPHREEPCDPKHYVPDDALEACGLCNTEFTLTQRRHHCRWCGGLVCQACSKGRARLAIPDSAATASAKSEDERPAHRPKKVRVCDPCVDIATEYERKMMQHAHHRSPSNPDDRSSAATVDSDDDDDDDEDMDEAAAAPAEEAAVNKHTGGSRPHVDKKHVTINETAADSYEGSVLVPHMTTEQAAMLAMQRSRSPVDPLPPQQQQQQQQRHKTHQTDAGTKQKQRRRPCECPACAHCAQFVKDFSPVPGDLWFDVGFAAFLIAVCFVVFSMAINAIAGALIAVSWCAFAFVKSGNDSDGMRGIIKTVKGAVKGPTMLDRIVRGTSLGIVTAQQAIYQYGMAAAVCFAQATVPRSVEPKKLDNDQSASDQLHALMPAAVAAMGIGSISAFVGWMALKLHPAVVFVAVPSIAVIACFGAHLARFEPSSAAAKKK